jgi:predicted nucleic acid-binding protein
MEWVDEIRGQLVSLDTAPLIYYLEADPAYLPLVTPFFEALAARELRVVTLTITLVEVLTKPMRQGAIGLARKYRELLLATQGLQMQPVSAAIAEEAARLRAAYTLRTPDAIQSASARLAGAHTFLTNDTRLRSVPDMQVILLGNV